MNVSLKKIVLATLLSVATVTPSFAATEIDESDYSSYGPTYGPMVADTLVGKPLGALAVAGGAALWLASLPFTTISGDTEYAKQKLITEPADAMYRCLGCTVAQDNYYQSHRTDNNQVRLVVDGPSEILINTDQNVVVASPR